SDDTARVIDAEVKLVIDRNYARSKQILLDNMDVLHSMKDALMKYETIDAKQIDDLIARREVRAPSNWHDEHSDMPQDGEAVAADVKPVVDETVPVADVPVADVPVDQANDTSAK
ncbi:MAG: ATP-dependent zinc metalloprotease FtsH, partial [Aeromonas sp.]